MSRFRSAPMSSPINTRTDNKTLHSIARMPVAGERALTFEEATEKARTMPWGKDGVRFIGADARWFIFVEASKPCRGPACGCLRCEDVK